METDKKICGNCMLNCKHHKYREITRQVEHRLDNGEVYAISGEFVRNEWYCDKGCDENFKLWNERNKGKNYLEYEKDTLDCYEPDEYYAHLHRMNELAQSILDNLNKGNK